MTPYSLLGTTFTAGRTKLRCVEGAASGLQECARLTQATAFVSLL